LTDVTKSTSGLVHPLGWR